MAKIFAASLIAFLVSSIDCGCVQKSPCVCALSEYSYIDLSQVIPEKNSKESTFLEDGKGEITYYFHGCKDEIYHNPTDNITAPYKSSLIKYNATQKATNLWESLGNSSQIKFELIKETQDDYQLVYRQTNGSVHATVRLICDNLNIPFIKYLEDSGQVVTLALSSPHACIITHHPGLSTGSILVILFFIAATLYLVAGSLIMYVIRGARGLELIPNIDFWKSLPSLVKDGIIFLFSGCSAVAISTPDSYDRI